MHSSLSRDYNRTIFTAKFGYSQNIVEVQGVALLIVMAKSLRRHDFYFQDKWGHPHALKGMAV